MLRAVFAADGDAAATPRPAVTLLYANHDAQSVMLAPELAEAAAGARGGLRVVHALSVPEGGEALPGVAAGGGGGAVSVFAGRITEELIASAVAVVRARAQRTHARTHSVYARVRRAHGPRAQDPSDVVSVLCGPPLFNSAMRSALVRTGFTIEKCIVE